MARLQSPIPIPLTVNTTPSKIFATELKVTSFIIQNPITSSDYIRIGNAAAQYFYIAPGRDLEVNGDNLDNGTTAYMNLAEWYVVSVSGTQTVNVLYLEKF